MSIDKDNITNPFGIYAQWTEHLIKQGIYTLHNLVMSHVKCVSVKSLCTAHTSNTIKRRSPGERERDCERMCRVLCIYCTDECTSDHLVVLLFECIFDERSFGGFSTSHRMLAFSTEIFQWYVPRTINGFSFRKSVRFLEIVLKLCNERTTEISQEFVLNIP